MKVLGLFGTLGGPLVRCPQRAWFSSRTGRPGPSAPPERSKQPGFAAMKITDRRFARRSFIANDRTHIFEDPGLEGVEYRHIKKQGLDTVVQMENWNGHKHCCMRSNRRKSLCQFPALSFLVNNFYLHRAAMSPMIQANFRGKKNYLC